MKENDLMAETTLAETEESRIYRLRWWTLLVLVVTSTVMAVNGMVLSVALPTIQTKLNATTTELQWIVNIYMLVAGALLLTFGALSDRLGRAKILQGGLVLFCMANLGALFCTNATHLIIARAFMGMGVAMMQPCILAVIVNVFPWKERGKAIGIWGGMQSFGVALGPILGGVILETFHWKWIFGLNISVATTALLLGWFLVPDSRGDRPHRLDLLGNVLFFTGMASLIYGLNNAGSDGWTDSVVLSTILGSVVVLILFVLWERRILEPLLDMKFFKRAGFSTGLIAIGIVIFCFNGVIYLLMFYMQVAKGYTPFETGTRLIPMALGSLVGAMLSHRLVSRLGVKRVISLSFAGLALTYLFIAFVKISTPFSQLGTELFFMGSFGSGIIPPASTMLMGSLPRAKAGIGSAMNNISMYVMGAIGVATLGSLLSSIYSDRFLKATESIRDISAGLLDKASESVGAAVGVAKSGQVPADTANTLVQAAGNSFMDGWQVVATVICIICVVGAGICLRFIPSRLDERKDTMIEEAGLEDGNKSERTN
jgi:DHA2 family multidrug resistance protein-like MFS transporter